MEPEYSVHKNPPLDIIPSHFKPIYLRSVLILFSNLWLHFASGLVPIGFPTETLCLVLVRVYKV